MTKLNNKIKSHAIEAYPHECVGYIRDGKYFKLNNVSSNPDKEYRISTNDIMKLTLMGNKLSAIVHSHPEMNNEPSPKDIKSQHSSGIEFRIVGTNGKDTTDIRRVK
tara:strand:+ start:115 stop:435 length:321 start_codon:yes stop_codon:yes gene_type:complete